MPTWDISYDGQIFYVASEKKVYVGTNTEFIELSPNGTTHDHNYLYHTRTEINAKFDTGSGHDHDGTNSKKILYSNLSGVPSEFNSSVHDNSHHSANYITAGEVSFNVLNNNSIVGTGATQVAKGDHLHDDRYFTESELGASTGASLVGVSNILNQSTVQEAFDALLLQLNNYRLITDSYTKSEVNTGFVSVSGSQEILGAKTFDDVATFKSLVNVENNIVPTTEINIGTSTNNFSRAHIRSLALDGEIYYKADLIKASSLYTKLDLQSSGSSQVHWNNLTSVPATFTPSTHNHNDLYYTETESDGKYSLLTHDHNLLYSNINHNHDSTYTTKAQNDALYAIIAHSHTKSSITDFVESDYVHTSENETITGNKNFESVYVTTLTTKGINLDIQDNAYPGIVAINGSNASVLKYDSTSNNYKVDQIQIVGEVPTTLTSSIIATRADTMTANSVPIWNNTTERFDSSSVTISGDEVSAVDLTLSGNLVVNGTTTSIDTTNLLIEDNIIVLNKNQTGAPPANLLSGVEIERGDSTNYQFLFRESDDLFVIGESTSLQAVATRDDTMTANSVPIWNDVSKKFSSSSVTIIGSTIDGDLNGNAASATLLNNARTINGVSFDGSANITITASTTAFLVPGTGLTGGNFDGSVSKTWAISFGTSSTTVARGDHTHGNITNTGYIGTTAGVPIITGTAGILQAGSFGTTSGTFAQGNHTHSDATLNDIAWSKVSNKPDPTITLTGAVTGSGTMTDLASVSIATTVNHDHDTVYYTETEVTRFFNNLVYEINTTYSATFKNPVTGSTPTGVL